METPIRVLVTDDHAILRRGLIEILTDAFPAVVIGEAGDGEEALQKCLQEAWDLVILDISLPKLSGLEVLSRIRPHKPDLRVIILSMNQRVEYVSGAIELGALGYISKEATADELEPAIRFVLNGGLYISRDIAARLRPPAESIDSGDRSP